MQKKIYLKYTIYRKIWVLMSFLDFIDFLNQTLWYQDVKRDLKKILKFFKISIQAFYNQLDRYFQLQCSVCNTYIL